MGEQDGFLDMEDGGDHSPPVRSVERAGRILEALLTAPHGLRLVELSERVGLHKTTTLRLLRTLVAINVVRKDEDHDRYHWDPLRWMLVARNLRESTARLTLLHEILQELANATGQTALLSTPDIQQRNMLLIASAASRSSVRVDLQGRTSVPLHAAASGKLYLAFQSEENLSSYLSHDLVAFTPHTLTSPRALRAQLQKFREQGYAVTREELLSGVAGVAVPVRDEQEVMVAGLALCGPSEQYTEAQLAQWLPQMRATAQQVSQLLYSPLFAPTEVLAEATRAEVSQSETKFQKNYRIL